MSTRREFLAQAAAAGAIAVASAQTATSAASKDGGAAKPGAGPSLLISGATVIDGVADKPIEGVSLWIERGRIKAIGHPDELRAPASVKKIDARGKYIIPGLMDANVHLLIDARMETLVRYEDRYEDVIAEAAQVALRNGLTTVFDSWGPRRPLMAVRDRIASGALQGSRFFCAGNIIGLDGPLSADFHAKSLEVASTSLAQRINSMWVENTGPDLSWMTPDQVAQEVRSYIGTGIDFIKYASSEHRGSEPNAFLLFSPLVQSRIVEEGHRAGITVQAHTSSVEGLRVAVEAGCDLIQHANISGPVAIPQSTIELMASKNTAAVIFPFTQRRLEMIMRNSEPGLRRYFSTVNENCKAFIRSSATLLSGGDAGLYAPEPTQDSSRKRNWTAAGEDNLAELGQGHFNWLKAMEEMGYPAMAALKSATRNIAAAYRKDKDLGTLEAGKIADLLILDKNPLQAAGNYRSINTIVKDGAIVNRDALPVTPIFTKPAAPQPDTTTHYGKFSTSKYP